MAMLMAMQLGTTAMRMGQQRQNLMLGLPYAPPQTLLKPPHGLAPDQLCPSLEQPQHGHGAPVSHGAAWGDSQGPGGVLPVSPIMGEDGECQVRH